MIQSETELRQLLRTALRIAEDSLSMGKVASYIPELGKADPSALEAGVACPNGNVYSESSRDDQRQTRFTIQSISKVVTLIFALREYGFDEVFGRIGMEATGDPFNSILKLEITTENVFNPLINAGAIVTANIIHKNNSFDELLAFARQLCADPGMRLNEAVYQSERGHGARNRSLAYMLDSKGLLPGNVEDGLDLYFKMCSVEATTDSLAHMGMVLSFGGVAPYNSLRLFDARIARCVKTLMFTCGMYDGSGEFAVRVGVPSKSGVGGGVVSCAGNGLGFGVYGPALDRKGNSVGGIRVLECLSARLGLHAFAESVSANGEFRIASENTEKERC